MDALKRKKMIKIDIEPPKSCYECPCTNEGFYQCMVTDKQLEDDCEERRPEWCPIIEEEETVK